MTCPNCGSGCTEFCGSVVQQRCSDCGTWWSPNTGEVLFVPERSKPVEAVELPDVDGRWWQMREDGTWDYIHVVTVSPRCLTGYKVGMNGGQEVSRGQYVRCVTPLVKPPVRDADAELLRNLAVWGNDIRVTDVVLPSKADLCRIAARLESEGKHE